jgi:hypothetical protein
MLIWALASDAISTTSLLGGGFGRVLALCWPNVGQVAVHHFPVLMDRLRGFCPSFRPVRRLGRGLVLAEPWPNDVSAP